MTIFTRYVWTVGQTGGKKISVFEQKRIRVDGALGFVHTNPDTFETAYSFDINDRPSVHTKPVNSVTETVLF